MRVLIVGAGIVGTSTALELGRRGADVTVLDKDHRDPRGSTRYAPGFVGAYNEAPVLTELARRSIESYRPYATSFRRHGGVELATSAEGAEVLARRVSDASAQGLRATFDHGIPLPSFVRREDVLAAAHYPDDAVADPARLRADIRAAAVAQGARFVDGAEATGIERRHEGWRVRSSDGDDFDADHVVLAGGIWGAGLASLVDLRLPLFPVAHPYVYARPGRPVVSPGPFVRWPEHHVYARAHHDVLGIGSYDHHPVPVTEAQLGEGANLPWDSRFDDVLSTAQRLLHPDARFAPDRRINGVFAMTPDNLPFLGPHPEYPDLWIAQAIWVTHAGGAAQAVSEAILDGILTPKEFAVDRFADKPTASLRKSALRLYRDIYANDAA